MKKILFLLVLFMISGVNSFALETAEIEESFGAITLAIDTIWIMVAGFMVFFMHAGFSLVEIGFTRSKNTINILMKNMVTVAIGVISFFFIGFGIAYGESILGFIGGSGFMLSGFGDLILGFIFQEHFSFRQFLQLLQQQLFPVP
jgi:Amt family ammonium transporter